MLSQSIALPLALAASLASSAAAFKAPVLHDHHLSTRHSNNHHGKVARGWADRRQQGRMQRKVRRGEGEFGPRFGTPVPSEQTQMCIPHRCGCWDSFPRSWRLTLEWVNPQAPCFSPSPTTRLKLPLPSPPVRPTRRPQSGGCKTAGPAHAAPPSGASPSRIGRRR